MNNSLDSMTQDELLVRWQCLKDQVETAKTVEMDMRKYIVSRAFPNKHEGTNTQELGNGYQLKAGIKYNYSLDPDNKQVEQALDKIALIGNQGSFIADRLVSWKPSLCLSEYRELDNEEIKRELHKVLTITEAVPTLEIKQPKEKKT